jgi:PAS domain S-box-containing protein
VSVSASAIRDAQGRYLTSRSIVLDIGERRRFERDHNRIFELSQDLLCVAGDDGYFKRINPAWGRLLGWDDDELTRRPFLEFVHPDDRPATVEAYERQIQAGQTIVSFENRYRCKDGSYRALLWNSTPVVSEGLVYGAAHDVTERNKADSWVRGLLESAPDAMIVVSSGGRIVLANAQAEALFGYPRAELRDQPVEMLIPERLRSGHPEFVAGYVAAPQVRAMGSGRELYARRRDGSEFPVEIGLSPVRSDEGLHVVAAIRDVSERRRAESLLRTAKETAEAANKELESFSYSVSHDLRAPLRAIDGFPRILLEEYGEKLDDEAQRLLGVLLANTAKMGQLIDDLLAFSRLGREPMRVTRVDMTALAGAVLRDALASGEASPQCTVHPLPRAEGDPALLRQVWVNLISNAIKFTARTQRAEIEVGAREEANAVVYWVRDNGAGFDMRYANKLFGVFQRLHRDAEFPGTGVGLAIVQRIVARHGGSVRAKGAVGAGATFEFSLPKRRVEA